MLLVGFVNQVYTPRLCLGIVDSSTTEFRWVVNDSIVDASGDVRGVNGLFRIGGHTIVGYQSDPTRMVVLDDEFRVVSSFDVPGLKDTHSFAPHDGKLLAASSRTDEIYALRLGEQFQLLDAACWWRHPQNKSGQDEHHVNSVAVHNGEVLATWLGRKQPGGWSKTVDGCLFNFSRQQPMMTGVHHPHTAYSLDGTWMLCESGTGTLICEGRRLPLGGYVRGMTHDEQHLYVAVSGRRLVSRSEGTLNVPPAATLEETKSAVLVVDRRTFQPVKRIDLGRFGTEIYDLAALERNSFPDWMRPADPVELKIRHLEFRAMELEAALRTSQACTPAGWLRGARKSIARMLGK